MLLYIVVYAGKICLVEHTEFDVSRGRGDYEVERVAQDGGVGNTVYRGEVKKGEGFFEAVEDTDFGEEQIT